MAHWKGHSERHLRAVEVAEATRVESEYEASLSKWFKKRRSCVCYVKKNALYYIASLMFMRGIEPLALNVSVTDLIYKHVFVGNMILITVALALITLNWILNAKEK